MRQNKADTSAEQMSFEERIKNCQGKFLGKTMDYSFRPITDEDRKPIIDIFNHYIKNTFAAYPETAVPYEAFDTFLQMTKGYPTATVKDENGNVIGFGFLRAYHPVSTFSKTAEITYFIGPNHTGKGIGRDLLNYLIEGAKEKGIKNILANISSLNSASISFHTKNGFKECGRFQNICKKKGQYFDVIWMQKLIEKNLGNQYKAFR